MSNHERVLPNQTCWSETIYCLIWSIRLVIGFGIICSFQLLSLCCHMRRSACVIIVYSISSDYRDYNTLQYPRWIRLINDTAINVTPCCMFTIIILVTVMMMSRIYFCYSHAPTKEIKPLHQMLTSKFQKSELRASKKHNDFVIVSFESRYKTLLSEIFSFFLELSHHNKQ